jgi:hypothetical protein
MTMVDNLLGFGANSVPSGSEYDEHTTWLEYNTVIGETISPDCP